MSVHPLFRIVTIGLVLAAFVACSKSRNADASCARCHMTIKPGDLHATDITYADGSSAHFDAAICAIYTWQHPPDGHTPKAMQLREYYDGSTREASAVMLLQNSDVTGPMGDDFIAVDPVNLKKFQSDHGGTAFKLADIKLAAAAGGP